MAKERLTAESWRGFRASEFPSQSWCAEGDELRARAGAEPIDLISRRRYRNFVLSLEWWLPEAGNSGIMYRASEDWPETWQSGPEMQLLDDLQHPDGARPETRCGALYDLLAPITQPIGAEPAFKTAQLRVEGSTVEHWLNGDCVLRYALDDPELGRRINQSKFRDYPAFGRQREGHVVLQHHRTDARFRNIHIEALPD